MSKAQEPKTGSITKAKNQKKTIPPTNRDPYLNIVFIVLQPRSFLCRFLGAVHF